MPIKKSAQKALRQSKKRRFANLQKASAYKLAVKQLKKLVAGNKTKEAEKALSKVYKALDKAAKTGVIKKNKASRLKSSASKMIVSKEK